MAGPAAAAGAGEVAGKAGGLLALGDWSGTVGGPRNAGGAMLPLMKRPGTHSAGAVTARGTEARAFMPVAGSVASISTEYGPGGSVAGTVTTRAT